MGKNLLAEALLGQEIHFTRFGIGSGEFDYEVERVHELTALKKFEMWLPLVEMKIQGDGVAYLKAYLSNAEVVKGFACREHGLFALDKDGNEILYSYRNVGEDYDFIPANTGSAHKNIFVIEVAEIQDAENVTAKLDLSVAYVNAEEFKVHVESERPHLNAPCHYDDINIADNLWGTDYDNHLHKISLYKLKEYFKGAEVYEKDIGSNELGLEANLLLIEDFADEVVSDKFKSKVTSSAENGNLLGLESPEKLRTCGRYVISDGNNAEVVTVQSILKNHSGYYARLKEPLAHSYSKNTYLYRSTPWNCEKCKLSWKPQGFRGINANIARKLEFEIDPADIEGDGFLVDGYYVLA